MNKIPLSFLDLAPVPEGKTTAEGVAYTVATAQKAEAIGMNRYWMAEHHNMPGIASAATSVLLSHIGAQTNKIRIGSGGVMLPNHSPLVVAEQFGTLQALYGDRIDLGLGRAPGTDGATFQALRRQMHDAERFPQDVQELLFFLGNDSDRSPVQAFPGAGSNVPIWILGSSLFGATLAAKLGLPYSFASHFAPRMLGQAIATYRDNFESSIYLDKPYVMLAANLLLAQNSNEARYHFTSAQQSFVRLRRGGRGQVPKPVESMDSHWNATEKAMVDDALSVSFIGSVDEVRPQLQRFIEEYKPDELMVTANIYDQQARLQSLELVPQLELFDLN
ncbi:LLM class flavin-dependent oxidoreductase [Psychrobacter sp. FDAARGOS_221]|uniref:LLM class flavin-dependent oxidoreductase n=1 Tax=Psychrobacter sp. FDAARGOS_221 TaxID=1975705 RepID=UPI000BB54387|nr:LLM class flavin-dependent oxidoreductase [Psychrobacter sp. FDAARGOS_221]PNK61391.1 LLM class flavin-dependent oxidoreductase [Psychrobacter sp. FDAARGOS_221]